MQTYEFKAVDAFTTLPRCESFSQACGEDELLLLHESSSYPNSPPLFVYTDEEIPEVCRGLLSRSLWHVDPLYCARLVEGTLHEHSAPVTRQGELLYDLWLHAGRHLQPPYARVDDDGTRWVKMAGHTPCYKDCTAAPIFPFPCCSHHSHWLVHAFAKISHLRQARVEPDLYVVLPDMQPYQRAMLSVMGIEENRLLVRDFHQPMKFRELYKSYTPNDFTPGDMWMYDEIASRIYDGTDGPERIYISRQDAREIRRFLNEEQVIEVAERYGFEILVASRMTFEEEVRVFLNARVIAGPVGAGLYNTLFTRPGATILGLSEPSYVMDWPMQVASLRGHRIGYLLGNAFLSMEPSNVGSDNSWVLDPRKFERILKEYL